jgi:multicomponent Na+:H+ antiporter subunit D
METVVSYTPLLAVLASLGAVPLIVVSGRHPNLREGWTFLAGLIKLGLVLSMLPTIMAGQTISCRLFEILPGLSLAFKVDAAGMLFALVAATLWLFTSAYSIGYMRGLSEHGQTRYFAFFAVALSATIGVAFAANLFTLYLFYEMLSLATYPLVTHHQDPEARASGRRYLTFILGTSIALALPAMLICYHLAGTLDFSAQGILAGTGATPALLTLLLLLFVFGFAKAAVMPGHGWLPAAMVAPTPVSALLHAVAVVKVGVFSIFRVTTGVFGTELLAAHHLGELLCLLAAVTIISASLIALSQDGLKRRLAFSTIGQLSYIVLGVALLSPQGLLGGLLHIAMHAFGKITLFFCAGAIFVATGRKNISEMTGIGRRMPVTMTAFLLGALSVIGLPPSGGFISKWYLALGTLEAGQIAMLVVLLSSSLLNAAYFLPVFYRAFFHAPGESQFEEGVQEAPLWCLVPLILSSAISLLLFFYPQPFFRLAQMAARTFTGG